MIKIIKMIKMIKVERVFPKNMLSHSHFQKSDGLPYGSPAYGPRLRGPGTADRWLGLLAQHLPTTSTGVDRFRT